MSHEKEPGWLFQPKSNQPQCRLSNGPGDAKCMIVQPHVSLRRHTRQLRRIEALRFQRTSLEKNFSIHASLQRHYGRI